MTDQNKPDPPERPASSPIRRGALWLLFTALMAIPKTLSLRRRPATWNSLRAAVALAAAGVAALGWTHHAVLSIAAGILLLLFALIPPERPKLSVDKRARELGALVVVDGGLYRGADGVSHPARLFVAPERIFALDPALRTLLEIPFAQVARIVTQPEGQTCTLRIEWTGAAAEFCYSGTFAEHLAQVAESTLRSQLHRELPVLP